LIRNLTFDNPHFPAQVAEMKRFFLGLSALVGLLIFGARLTYAFTIPVTEFTLDNGIQVIVIEDHRAPVVMHAIGYRVGGADEEPGKTGLAHFFEHLMFKGTVRYPKAAFSTMMDDNGVEKNAFTTHDLTVYYERGNAKLLEQFVDLDSDRMQNLVLTDEIFETERKVVQEERRQQTESNPMAVASEQVDALLFKLHPYGKPVVGWTKDVAAVTLKDANDFYRQHYMPQNAIVLVVGDVATNDVRKLAERYYGPLKNNAAPKPRKRPDLSLQAFPQRLELQDGRISDPVILRKFIVPARDAVSERESAAFDILAAHLGGSSQSRLEKELVTGSRQATYAGAYYNSDALTYGTFQIYIVAAPASDTGKIEKDVDAILKSVAEQGMTAAELDSIKERTLSGYIYQLDEPVSFAVMIGFATALGISHENIYGRDKTIADVTLQDVQSAARMLYATRHDVTLVLRGKP
jgi:zinc protease